jgi:hypothetical protein
LREYDTDHAASRGCAAETRLTQCTNGWQRKTRAGTASASDLR